MNAKQGDPRAVKDGACDLGNQARSVGGGEVRASIVAQNRGNSRGAKGRRKVNA